MNDQDDFFNIEYENYQPLEIMLEDPENFLKVKETLSRIGVASKKDNTLYQSCHILHKQGRYFITHFKELFALDGKEADFTENDIARRNTIGKLLQEWGLIKIKNDDDLVTCSMSQVKIISYKDKKEWNLVPKYNIGKKR
jgi:alanine racemase